MLTIEEKVFQRKRFDRARMLRFGFQSVDGVLQYSAPFMDGDFVARLSVSEKGQVRGTVIDAMNGEEYAQLRIEQFNGAYVNSVRSAYEALLTELAEACCRDVPFASEQANRITERIAQRFGVCPDFPWGRSPHENSGVFRHTDTGKWFALIMNITRHALERNGDRTATDAINLKIDPQDGPELTGTDGIYPAYHMNHKSWITVTLDERLSDDAVMTLIENSFRLTAKTAAGSKKTHP